MRKLPSLKLLVTFEAAARHLSFKAAAEELFVTPSAVSHQIRTLEEALKTSLFIRLNRSIELTEEGQSYFAQVEDAIRTLYSATDTLLAKGDQKSLLIHSIPYLTNTYLVPNIKSLKDAHPDMKIAIESRVERARLGDPNRSDIQVAIRHGKGDDDKLVYETISPVRISPVCSPSYDLEQSLTQIKLSTDSMSWLKWQSDWQMPLTFIDEISCDGMQAVVDLTEQNLGIAMGYFPFIDNKLASGELVLAYPGRSSELDALYLTYAKTDRDEAVIAALRSWLKAIFNVQSTAT